MIILIRSVVEKAHLLLLMVYETIMVMLIMMMVVMVMRKRMCTSFQMPSISAF